MSLSISAHPSRSSTMPIASGLCRRTKLKTCSYLPALFVVFCHRVFVPGFSVLFTDVIVTGFMNFLQLNPAQNLCHTASFFRYAKTHSQETYLHFPHTHMADKVFQLREFSGSSKHKHKNNGDCYDTTRGCCSWGAGDRKSGVKGYLAFSHDYLFPEFFRTDSWWRVFDFSVLNGSFGQLPGANGATTSFRGAGGTGAKDGFLFALELAPSVILSLGIISITDGLGGLRAAQQLMTPVLKPLLGIPGICSLALIANLQNTDAAARYDQRTGAGRGNYRT